MENLVNDIKLGARSLLRTPALTGVALLALALGIGANTSIFSVIKGVLLQPLPYADPERLVVVVDSNPKIGFPRFNSSPANFADWRRQSQSFERLAAAAATSFNLIGRTGGPERLTGARVSWDFFDLFGMRPIAGRGFQSAEDRPGSGRVVVIGHGLWLREFGADPQLLGKTLRLNGDSYTVVGIMPGKFDFPGKTDIWVPLALQVTEDMRSSHYLRVYGRLKPGVTLQQAGAEMSGIAARLEQQHRSSNDGWGVVLFRLKDLMVEDIRPALTVLMAAVGLVLLIACANVANLLLARMARREREVTIRTALGAKRGRLLRQFLTESLLLSTAGGAVGLLLALWGTQLLVSLNPDKIPRAGEIAIDVPVLLFTLALSLLTGVIFGLLPALHASRTNLQDALKGGGRATTTGAKARFAKSALVVLEVAMALILLTGAGLLLRSFIGLQRVSPGFNPANVLTMQVTLPEAKYREEAQQGAFFQELLPRVRALPGVKSAGAGTPLPLSGDNVSLTFTVEGRPAARSSEAPNANVSFVTPGYLQALGIPSIRGRQFTDSDGAKAPHVVLINRTMARRLWPKEDPLGRRITFSAADPGDEKWFRIVGIVGDVRHETLATESAMGIYAPALQAPFDSATLVVRTARDPQQLAGEVRAVIHQLDSELPVFRVRTMEQVVAQSMTSQRFSTVLLAVFAVIALLLASVGVYAVISYSVSQRSQEIGLRMALGAQRRGVLRLVVRQGMLPVLYGVAVGLLGALLGGRLLDSLLFGVSSKDPVTLVAVPLLLLSVALFASCLPGMRATRIDPAVAMRYE